MFEKDIYAVFAEFQAKGGSMSTLMDAINAKYNNTAWKTFSDIQPMSKSKRFGVIMEEAKVAVKASILSAYGNKPLRGFEGFEKFYESMRKVGHGFKIGQEDIDNIEDMNYADEADANKLLDIYVNRFDSIVQGVHSLWNSWIYCGLSKYGIELYNQGKLEETIDLHIGKDQKLVATSATSKGWFAADFDGDKRKDLLAMDAKADKLGMPAARMNLISKSLAEKLMLDESLRKVIVSTAGFVQTEDVFVKRSTFLTQLSNTLGIAPFVVIDEKSRIEMNGTPMDDTQSFDENKIILVPAGKMFNFFPSKPDYANDTNPATVKGFTEGGIIGSLTEYSSKPFGMITDVEAWGFPMLKNPKYLVGLDTSVGNKNGVTA